MRMILAEDDAILGSAMHKALTRSAFAVDWVRSGHDFRQAVSLGEYECALLDLLLPDDQGEELLRQARRRSPRLPVIVVTGRREVREKVKLLDMGADDYVVKPFDLDELVARVRSVLRRTPPPSADADDDAFCCGALRLNPQRHSASWYGIPVELTRHEFCVLEALARRKGQVLTRAQLEDSVYGWGQEVESNAVEVYVHRLRRKFSPDLIETVRGLGYQLVRIGAHA